MTPLYFLGVGFELPKLEPLPPPPVVDTEPDPDDLLLYGEAAALGHSVGLLCLAVYLHLCED
jgi:hypothetical protein